MHRLPGKGHALPRARLSSSHLPAHVNACPHPPNPQGASVLFFPEGTRSKDGRMHAFKKGAFSVAAKAKARYSLLCSCHSRAADCHLVHVQQKECGRQSYDSPHPCSALLGQVSAQLDCMWMLVLVCAQHAAFFAAIMSAVC